MCESTAVPPPHHDGDWLDHRLDWMVHLQTLIFVFYSYTGFPSHFICFFIIDAKCNGVSMFYRNLLCMSACTDPFSPPLEQVCFNGQIKLIILMGNQWFSALYAARIHIADKTSKKNFFWGNNGLILFSFLWCSCSSVHEIHIFRLCGQRKKTLKLIWSSVDGTLETNWEGILFNLL